MLAAYPGTLLLVSHDRDFLDRVVTSVIAYEGDAKWIEYGGGYSDMVAQRGFGVDPRRAEKPADHAPRLPPLARRKAEPKRRLTFTDQHALKTSPGRIEALNAEIRRLEGVLSDPGLYARDQAGFTAAAVALQAAQAALGAAEEEWTARRDRTRLRRRLRPLGVPSEWQLTFSS
jgi:ABC transport system ATP-binding/permease protein